MSPQLFQTKVKLMRQAQNEYFALRKTHKPSDPECKDALKKSKALESEVDKFLKEQDHSQSAETGGQEGFVKPPSLNMQKPFFTNDYLGQ